LWKKQVDFGYMGMKITKEYLESIDWLEHSVADEYRLRAVLNNPNYMFFISKDGRLAIRNVTNLSQDAWNFHLDNEDMDSLASFDVETVEDANTILNIYKYKTI